MTTSTPWCRTGRRAYGRGAGGGARLGERLRRTATAITRTTPPATASPMIVQGGPEAGGGVDGVVEVSAYTVRKDTVPFVPPIASNTDPTRTAPRECAGSG